MKKNKPFRELFYHSLKKTLLTMRISIFLLILGILQAHATDIYSQKTMLSLDFSNTELIKVLDKIEDESEFFFLYNEKLLDLDRLVSVNAKNKSINDILDNLFAGTDVKYTIIDRKIILAPDYLTKNAAELTGLQNIKISGKVTDATTGEPIIGSNIKIEGTSTGTITDAEGKFSLDVPSIDAVLIFSFIGYLPEKIVVNNQSVINVKLSPDIKSLEEVVVVGYGVQKKSVVTAAISQVKAEDIAHISITQTEQALQGRVSGVQVIQNSGSPGSGMSVRIRGTGTNGDPSPLFIVDGVRTRDISDLAPTDVASMEVLKDAASAAIYGAEGGNGVVIITTKSGVAGKSKLTYDFQYSWDKLGKIPKVLNAQEYIAYANESGMANVVAKGHNTDWVKALFTGGVTQNHSLSFSTGTDKAKTMISASYVNQDGIVISNKDTYKRFSVRANGDYKVADWLKIGNNFNYSHADRSAIIESSEFGGILASALMMDPLTPTVYTDASEVPPAVAANPLSKKDANGNYFGVSKYVGGEIMNPLITMANQNGSTISDRIFGSAFAELSLIKDLKLTSRLGLDVSYNNKHNWNPTFYYTPESSNTVTTVAETYNNTYFWQWENFLSYNKSIGNHNISAVLGMAADDAKSRFTNLTAGPMNVELDSYGEFDYTPNNGTKTVGGHTEELSKLSYFGRFTYDYKQKYLLEGSLRRDGASLSYLPKEGRWGLFRAISVGWVISNEDFSPKTILNYAKVRASWGENGSLSSLSANQYGYIGFLTSNNQYYVSGDGSLLTPIEPSRLGNPDLTWENSTQSDIGIDIRALDNKLNFSADYYYKKTKDLLTTNTPPFEAGNTASYINAGDVVNKGLELEIGYKSSISDFNYAVNFNLSTLKNEVTYLNPTVNRLAGTFANGNSWIATYCEKGFPIWYFRGYKTNGIDPATGEANIVDVNHDGKITTDDYTDIGNPHPKLVLGGNINLSYKGIDLSMFLQGSLGNDILLSYMRNDRPGINRMKLYYDERWTPTTTNALMPKAGANAAYWNSDLVVFDGSYVRVKQIQIGYTLPKIILKKISLQNLRGYVSLENFFTFTKYPGFDPEVGSTSSSGIGIDKGIYPASKKIVFGASITF